MDTVHGKRTRWPGPELAPALKDFWNIYDRDHVAISAEALPVIERHPVFATLNAGISAEAREAQGRASRERLRAAIEGDWGPYEAHLRMQGVTYARVGIAIRDWYDISRVFSQSILPRLVAEYASDPHRLARALTSMRDLLDSAMSVLAESYLEEKERLIREGEERLSATLDSIGDAVITTDPAGRIDRMNPVAERLTGWTAAEANGVHLTRVFAIYDEETNEPTPNPVERVVREGTVVGLANHTVLVSRDGRRIPIADSGAPIRDRSGRVAGVVVVFRDMTEHHRAERERTHNLVLEAENARVREATRLKSEFLANMSHELRTPLNAIIGFTELIHDERVRPGMPEYKAFLADVLSSASHLLKLINDVLDLSKVEAGKLEFFPERVNLRELVREAVSLLGQARSANVAIEVEVAPELVEVDADPSRLRQILYNYLSNALKFTPDGGRVTVRVRPEGHAHFRVEVEDTGTGIAAADLPRLFTEFQQLDAGATKRYGGTGLGLALTRRLVEAQGGTVGVRSEPGRGSVFHAILPRGSVPTRPTDPPPTRALAWEDTPTILVVEDDVEDQSSLVLALLAEGYAVETARTGAAACAMLGRRAYAAITLDLVLPDMGGLDVLRHLRSEAVQSNVPVLVVTRATDPRALAGFRVHDFLPKPLDPRSLLASLRRAGVTIDRDGDVLVVDDDPSSLRLMAATLAQLGYRAACAASADEGLRLVEQAPPVAVIVDLLMPVTDGFGFLEALRAIPTSRDTPVIVWTVKDLTPVDRARIQDASARILLKGRGTHADVLGELRALLFPCPLPNPPPADMGREQR